MQVTVQHTIKYSQKLGLLLAHLPIRLPGCVPCCCLLQSPLVQFANQLLQKAAARMAMRSSSTQELQLGEQQSGGKRKRQQQEAEEEEDHDAGKATLQ